jgi:benzoylformate decarboxylase
VIGLLGDGSAMYSIQALWTAGQLNLPVAFIIVNNSSYRALEDFGRHFGIGSLPGISLPRLDFCALAQGQGVRGIHVERCEDLDAALVRVFQEDTPMLLEVRVK